MDDLELTSDEVCRTCLSSQALGPLFSKPAQYRSFQLALRLTTGLQMDFSDGLPQYICRICNQTVEALLLFRFQSQVANEKLWKYYKNKHKNIDSTNMHDSVKLENFPSSNDLKNEAKNRLSSFFKNKRAVPNVLYCITDDTHNTGQHLIVVKSQNTNLTALRADEKKILQNTHKSIIVKKNTLNLSNKENSQEKLEYLDLKPVMDNDIDTKELLQVKDECKNEYCDKDEKRKYDISDSEDVWSERDDDTPLNVFIAESEKPASIKKRKKVNKKSWNISVDVKPTIQNHQVKIKASSKLRKKSKRNNSAQGHKEISKINKSVAREKKKNFEDDDDEPKPKRRRVRIKLSEEDVKKFHDKCLKLIEGSYMPNSKNLKCKDCKKIYKDIFSFRRHAQRHIGYKHVCEHCNRGFESRDIMTRHIQVKHPKGAKDVNEQIKKDRKREEFRKQCLELIEGAYDQRSTNLKCKTCHNVYKDIFTFERHAQRHLGFKFSCEYCQRGFGARLLLVQHTQRKHPEELKNNPNSSIPPLKENDIIRRQSENGTEFRRRCMEIIEGPVDRKSSNVQCKLCAVVCKSLHSFEQHAQIHLGFKHLCEFCAKGFPSRAHLKLHLQAFHGLAKELSCSYCDYKAILRSQLKVHENRVHTKERPFVCDECGSGYFSKPVLTQHIRHSHREEKPFKCDECPRRFKRTSEVNYHKKRAHHPTFTFLCHICNSMFKTTGIVRSHYLKIHKIPREQQVEKIHRFYFDQPERLQHACST